MKRGFSVIWVLSLTLIILVGFLVLLFVYSVSAENIVWQDKYSVEDQLSLREKESFKRISQIERELGGGSFESDQASAVVKLWCPDDNYEQNAFVNIGSGTIISSDGIILTNKHVVLNQDATVIRSSPACYVGVTEDISKPVDFKYTADIIASSPASPGVFSFDVAVLKITEACVYCAGEESFPEEFPYVEMGNSSSLFPGDEVSIIGYPAIGAGTWNYTQGIISGKLGEFILKTDAKIDAGNSGGAALNDKNELIGIPAWIISGAAESIGYIITIDEIKKWYEGSVLPGL
ncbi:MAG: hypothetical protein A2365_02970 [Candidatus Nealsonbacteria bacterium RIFOXYB1_FULL_40_15]|uniref:Serine protease n=2 Tax=Candidatus Nealsoniibacteriota TaxID=1817911 RepID=A0A1G2EV03_9BACT|nr:MAG: hypothetical protein A2365_02970 [Candidatus Nealsonbacteria bacterium RIFOXYB1_FULL_40_15]OGZ29190.1 MAG: hypothetical protein A2427_02825 [Candidatus Nealsonbacteria bacterium RIFOXYC1_FULL_40_7]OGZ29871.1 MAG: hypothetical protein A2562_02005 [Candidatus Nealsonbacteria bacterium RIFOXYD1_FULL_39_11]